MTIQHITINLNLDKLKLLKISNPFKRAQKDENGLRLSTANSKNNQSRIHNYIPLEQDIKLKQNREKELFREFLVQKGKITPIEFEIIKKEHPTLITEAQKYVEKHNRTKLKPDKIGKAALCLKDCLDRHFGENCYRIISLGTSPANMMEVMRMYNKDVVFLPASGLNGYVNQEQEFGKIYDLKNYPNIKTMLAYLDKNGVNAKQCEKDGKVNIILDFCNTGQGMTNIYHFIQERNGIPEKKLIRADVGKLLYTAVEEANEYKKPYAITTNDYAVIMGEMLIQTSEDTSSVPHFYIYEKIRSESELASKTTVIGQDKTREQIFKEFENYSTPLARAFNLCSLNIANLYKKNPE